MTNMPLWGAMLKSTTSFLSKSLLFLRAGSTEKPALVRLEYDAEQKMIVAEFETKENLPTTALIPINAVAYIVPEPKQAQLDTGFSVPTRPANPAAIAIPAMPVLPAPQGSDVADVAAPPDRQTLDEAKARRNAADRKRRKKKKKSAKKGK